MKPAEDALKLPRRAINVWRINNSGWSLLLWVVPLFFWVLYLTSDGQQAWFIWGLTALVLFITVLLVVIIPKIRWREWYYHIDEEAVELQNGVIILQQTLVPLNRVQHVDTRQGPVLDNYNLADVIISTAATKHKIPALDTETAEQVRKQILQFARKAREDV